MNSNVSKWEFQRNSELREYQRQDWQYRRDDYETSSAERADLRQIISVLWRRKNIIFWTILLGCGLAAAYVFIATPKYTATTQLLIDPREVKVIKADLVLAGLGTDKAVFESQVGVIRSRAIGERVLQRITPEGAPPPVIKGESEDEFNRLLDGLEVVQKGRTFIIELNYTDPDPVRAAQIANAFSEAYLNDQLEGKYKATTQATEWLNARIVELREQVITIEEQIESYKAKHKLVFMGGKMLDEQQIGDTDTQAMKARVRLQEATAKLQQFEGGNLASFASNADVLQSQVIRDLRDKHARAASRVAEISTRYGRRHPEVADARAQERDAKQEIDAEIQRIVASARQEYALASAQVESLEKQLDKQKLQFDRTNQVTIRLRELEREAKASQTLLVSFMERYKETKAQESLQTADGRIIASARPPLKPSKPRKSLTLILAFLTSLGVGTALAFVKDYFDNVFENAEDVRQSLGLAHLTSIPLVAAKDKRGTGRQAVLFGGGPLKRRQGTVVVDQDDADRILQPGDSMFRQALERRNSPYAQSIFVLKSALETVDVQAAPAVLMLASADHGEGKTTTAINLAHYSALLGKKTLLIDCDLRNPNLTASILPHPRKSIIDILSGSAKPADVFAQDPQSGLYFCPAPHGQEVELPMDILGSEQMADFLQEMRSSFDLVLLDVAPLIPLVDARPLVAHVDKVIFVIKSATTPRDRVLAALDSLQSPASKVLGVVLNQVTRA